MVRALSQDTRHYSLLCCDLPFQLGLLVRTICSCAIDHAVCPHAGAPVSMYKELAKANKHQMATVQAALVKSQAAADSSRATMVMHLLCPQDIEQLFTVSCSLARL